MIWNAYLSFRRKSESSGFGLKVLVVGRFLAIFKGLASYFILLSQKKVAKEKAKRAGHLTHAENIANGATRGVMTPHYIVFYE